MMAKEGGLTGGFGRVSLPHAILEWRGQLIAGFMRMTPVQQEERVSRACRFANRLGATAGTYTSTAAAALANKAIEKGNSFGEDGCCWREEKGRFHDGEALTEGYSPLSQGQALAFNALLAAAGEEQAGLLYRRIKAKYRSRDREAEMFKEAFKWQQLRAARKPTGPQPMTVWEALAAGKAGSLGMVGKLVTQGAAIRIAEEEATSAAEAMAAREAAAAAEKAAVSAVRRWRWQRVFEQIVRKACSIRHAEHLEHAVDMCEEAADDYAHECKVYTQVSEYFGKWADLSDALQALIDARAAVVELEGTVRGLHHFARYWCARAAKRVAIAKRGVPRPKRLNAAARAAEEEAVRRTFIPSYLMPTAAAAYTKPIEEIRSVRFGNLPLASGMKQCAELRNAMRDFAVRHGAVLAEAKKGDGNIFCPQRGPNTIGFGFIKCSTAANAKLFLERIKALEHPMLVDPVTGDERELFIELAASEHKTKAQMEAEKAAKAASVTSESKRIIDMMKAANTTATVPKLLEPVCLGAAIKAAKSTAAAEAEAAMRARLDAMFAPSLPTDVEVPVAKQFEICYAAMAAKPVVKPTEVIIDPFSVVVDGEKWGLFHSRTTELGKAQAALQARLEAEAAKPALLAQRKRRAERKKRNAGKEAWDQEEDSDEE